MPSNLVRIAVAAVAMIMVAAPAAAQTGRGIPVPPLPAGPFEYRAGEGMAIRVVVLTRGLGESLEPRLPARRLDPHHRAPRAPAPVPRRRAVGSDPRAAR
jgi:hypothetical protein